MILELIVFLKLFAYWPIIMKKQSYYRFLLSLFNSDADMFFSF